MKEEAGVKLSQTLYARAEKIWPRYLCHPFVTQMADGTLPPEKFRYYMLQDYLYLKDYVKIFAAIIQKADDFEQIRFPERRTGGHHRRDPPHASSLYEAPRHFGGGNPQRPSPHG